MQWPPFTLFAYTDVRMREIWLRTIWQTENRQMENSVMSSNSFVTFFLLLMISIDGACRDCLVPVCFQCRSSTEDQLLLTKTVQYRRLFLFAHIAWINVYGIKSSASDCSYSHWHCLPHSTRVRTLEVQLCGFILSVFCVLPPFYLQCVRKKQPLMFSCITLRKVTNLNENFRRK